MNIGEEICGEWLRHVKKCEFIQYNLKTPDTQGEIDVIGLDIKNRIVYACEVAIHLVTGLQYNKNAQPDNVPRLTAKFRKDILYVRKNFEDFKHVFMLWSPIVRNQKRGSKYNQVQDTQEIAKKIKDELNAKIEVMINGQFQDALVALRGAARNTSKELDSSVMRYLQVEERLVMHLRSAGMKEFLTPPSPSPAA
jgi:hypothetical protein